MVVLDDLQWAPADRVAELLRRPPRGPVLVALGFRTLPADDRRRARGRRAPRRADRPPAQPAGPRGGRGRHRRPRAVPPQRRQPVLPARAGQPEHEGDRGRDRSGAGGAHRARPRGWRSAWRWRATADWTSPPRPPTWRRSRWRRSTSCSPSGLLQKAGPRRYRFRRPIVSRAVYGTAGEGWRLAAHERAAARSPTGRPRPATSSTAPSAATSRRSPRSSRRPRARLPPPPRAGTPPRCGSSRPTGSRSWSALAHSLAATGHDASALAVLTEALTLDPANAELAGAAATCEHLLGRHATARARLDDLPPLEQRSTHSSTPTSTALAARAASAAEAETDPVRECGRVGARRPGPGLARRERDRAGSRAPRPRRARARASTSASPTCSPSATRTASATCAGSRAATGCRRGSWSRRRSSAAAASTRRWRRPRRRSRPRAGSGNEPLIAWALAAEAEAAVATGDRERALAAGRGAAAIAGRLDPSIITVTVHALLAPVFLKAGRPERCLEQARLAGTRLEPSRRATHRGRRSLARSSRSGVRRRPRKGSTIAEAALERDPGSWSPRPTC